MRLALRRGAWRHEQPRRAAFDARRARAAPPRWGRGRLAFLVAFGERVAVLLEVDPLGRRHARGVGRRVGVRVVGGPAQSVKPVITKVWTSRTCPGHVRYRSRVARVTPEQIPDASFLRLK